MSIARAVTDEVGNLLSDDGFSIDNSLDTLNISLEPIYEKKDYSRAWEKLHEQCLKIDGDFKFDLQLSDLTRVDNYKELARVAVSKGNKADTRCKIYRSDEKNTYVLITLSGDGFMKADENIKYRKGITVHEGSISIRGIGRIETI